MSARSTNGNGRLTLDRWLTIIALTLAISSAVFSIGVNWSRLSSVEDQVKELKVKVDAHTLQIAATDGDMKVILTRLNELAQNFSELKGYLYRPGQQPPK